MMEIYDTEILYLEHFRNAGPEIWRWWAETN